MERRASSTTGLTATVARPSARDVDELPLDLWLRPEAEVPCAQDLPLLLGPDASSHRVVTRVGGRVVSHAALYEHIYAMPDGTRLRVGVIGAVATDPDHRRQGHAARCVLSLQEHARAAGMDLVVLWDEGDNSLYTRRGFVRAGREVLHQVTRWSLPVLPDPSWVRPLERRDIPAVRALHERELASTVRTPETWHRLLAVPRTDVWVLDRDDGIEAYGVLGKGNDLKNCLHEWGGFECALPALLAGIFGRRHDVDELVVMSAPWKQEAARALAFHGLGGTLGVLGMIWLPDAAKLATRLGRVQVRDLGHEDIVHALFDGESAAPFYLRGLDSM